MRVTDHSLAPRDFLLQHGGRVRLLVEEGPPQSFSITCSGGDSRASGVETPLIPAGEQYQWCAAAGGREQLQQGRPASSLWALLAR